ncbi:MAG: hypothetical protein ACN4GG_04530 [Akkermansiaceae bacterium]
MSQLKRSAQDLMKHDHYHLAIWPIVFVGAFCGVRMTSRFNNLRRIQASDGKIERLHITN